MMAVAQLDLTEYLLFLSMSTAGRQETVRTDSHAYGGCRLTQMK